MGEAMGEAGLNREEEGIIKYLPSKEKRGEA